MILTRAAAIAFAAALLAGCNSTPAPTAALQPAASQPTGAAPGVTGATLVAPAGPPAEALARGVEAVLGAERAD